jgi:glycosyltransferase involved in cell wall biosynthesis
MPSAPVISAVVPARNEEAAIARAVESLAAQPEIAEIIVVDDQSTDRTAAVLEELAAQIPRLRVVQGAAPAAGWTGKNFAIAQGVAQARGKWLLFTDADVEHLPGSAARALEDAATFGAALVSYSPEQETRAWWERAVIPFIFCRLAAHFSYERVSDPTSPDAAANGQYLLIRREAYEAIGGHAAVCGEVVEDVALARRAKQAGQRIHFATGEGIARTRMYRSAAEMWEGWTKNLYLQIGGRPWSLFRELIEILNWLPVALIAMALFWVFSENFFLEIGAVPLVTHHLFYAMTLRKNRYPSSRIIYYLPASIWYTAALVDSAWRYSRGTVTWKGREIPIGAR